MAVADKYTELELYDLELNEQLQYLDRKIEQLEQDLEDPPDNSIPESIDRDQLPETIYNLETDCDRLKEQLSEAFHQIVIKNTAEHSLDMSHTVIKSLFPEDQDEQTVLFQEIEKRDDLVSEFLLTFEELRPYLTWIKETEANIMEVQSENKALMASVVKAETAAKEAALAREASQRIQKLEREAAVKSDTLDRQQAASAQGSNSAGPSEDPRAMTDEGGSQRRVEESEEGLQRRIKRARNMVEFARNVLQGIIIESGIDWAEDERWMDVMLSAGEEI
ncbi:hypothetical protein NQZ79_g4620 [Umbelopsis isabellina]|nr:hypothetical protein NQZ79_g4620 [Umbelopsis isabellina]